MRSHYCIVKAYPLFGGGHFYTYSSAVVGFWINEEVIPDANAVAVFVREHLAVEGWDVIREVSRTMVSLDSYPDGCEGFDKFQQSLIDGHTAQFHVRRRETMGKQDSAESILSDYLEIIRNLNDAGGTLSLRPPAVTEDGDPFQPVWCDLPTKRWHRTWPLPTCNRVSGLKIHEVLSDMSEQDVYCGLIRGEGLIVFHAEGVARDISRKLWALKKSAETRSEN